MVNILVNGIVQQWKKCQITLFNQCVLKYFFVCLLALLNICKYWFNGLCRLFFLLFDTSVICWFVDMFFYAYLHSVFLLLCYPCFLYGFRVYIFVAFVWRVFCNFFCYFVFLFDLFYYDFCKLCFWCFVDILEACICGFVCTFFCNVLKICISLVCWSLFLECFANVYFVGLWAPFFTVFWMYVCKVCWWLFLNCF